MSVSLICPSCGTPATIDRLPAALCPTCQQPWPEPLRLAAEASLARQKTRRPMLLTVGMYGAVVFGGCMLLLLLAPLEAARYTVNGATVSRAEFVRHLGLLFAVLGGSALATAYAIWRERSWSRLAIVFFWMAVTAGTIAFGWVETGLRGVPKSLLSLLPVLFPVGLYLYVKDDVVQYYRALEKEEAATAARRESR